MYAIAYLIDGLLDSFGMAMDKSRVGCRISNWLTIVAIVLYLLAFLLWAFNGTLP